MKDNQTTPISGTLQKRFKGSLAGTLVRTLLLFIIIPLSLMAGAAYFRARNLLREQAISQTESLLVTQLSVVQKEIDNKESRLQHLHDSSDFAILTELALHANPMSDEFKQIRKSVNDEFINLNKEQNTIAFDQFILMDLDGNVKVSSNEKWQGLTIEDTSVLNGLTPDNASFLTYSLSPLFENSLSLVTILEYKTSRGSSLGYLVGITEATQMHELLRPIEVLSPLANAYFILPGGEFIAMDTQNGQFVPFETVSKSQQNILAPKLTEMRENNITKPSPFEITRADGKETLTQIQWFPSMRTGVALEVGTDSVYSGLNSLAPFTIGSLLLILLATSVVIFVGINRITRPLRGLADITKQFAEGNWNSRAKVESEDEVGLLANSYNQMADELSRVYQSLEYTADERSRQIRTAAEVAQNITSLTKLSDVLNQTVELLVKQFGFYQASIFLTDTSGKNIDFKAGFGAETQSLKEKRARIKVGSESIVGWVSANNEARIISGSDQEAFGDKNDSLPEAHSQAAVPISTGNLVLGVLDIQSMHPDAFNTETMNMLRTLASQVATAIQNTGLTEASQVNFNELSRLYRSSKLVAKANTETEILQISTKVLEESPHTTIILGLSGSKLRSISASSKKGESVLYKIPVSTNLIADELQELLSSGPLLVTSNLDKLPISIRTFTDPLELTSVALIPITKGEALFAVLVIGSEEETVNNAFIQPYSNFADLISIILEKTDAERQTEKHLKEVESLASVSEAISTSSDLPTFFKALHDKIKQVIGNYSFMVALYDARNNTISIPFSYENDQFLSIDSFPLGDGLTSILLRTRQPLLLMEETEKRAIELGAKIQGSPAKSWMGAPMMVQNNPIGALILQDSENELAFTNDDYIFFTTVANQVAGVINNVRLLEESNKRALQLETAAEIARDISGSLNLDELLIKAVNLIHERFDFYHAAVFLQDLPGEFALIREATGEAGTQLKRTGYKIGVGSKSIVGFVTSRGEQLVVNDTATDATFNANPLLPDTKSEAAFPLKVGERILGALDVQSTKSYAFTEDNLRSLQILSDQMAIAVVNTELFAETQEHLSQHRLLHHITTTAASGTTLEEALESAVTGLQVTLGGDRVTILLADREKKQLEIKASVGYAEDITRVSVPIGSGITGWAASNRRPLRVQDVTEDPRYIQVSSNTRSELAIPLIYRNELLGVLNVESEQVDAYTENDEEMLGTLGGSLAAIIANARLLEQIRQQVERDRVVYEVTSKIRRSTDIQSILATTASELTRVTGSRQTKIKINPEIDGNKDGK